MSNQLHDGESDRKKQVKFRARDSLIEQFDDAIDGARSAALRDAMREVVEEHDQREQELDVPKDDEELATSYEWLVENQNTDGIVALKRAKNRLAQKTSYAEDDILRYVLKPLETRGYLVVQFSPPGDGQQEGCVRVREIRRGAMNR